MLLLLDYGIGNVRSLEKAFAAVGVPIVRSAEPADVARAEGLVVPGVGAFGACAAELRARGLWTPVQERARAGVPLLGVCVGMQLLFEVGEENGLHEGLGLLPGRVARLPTDLEEDGRRLKVPHVGWNALRPLAPHPLLDGLGGAHVYFVHSYHAAPAEPADVLATARYGLDVPAVVGRRNVMGAQFHPEKSQAAGLRLLRNFADLSTGSGGI